MKRLLFLLLWILTFQPARADGPIYLPLLFKGESMAIQPILRVTNGTDVINLLGNESGWELEDPYWNPQIAQYKSGGSYVNSGLAEGQRLVHKEYDNVVETIPLSARGINQDKAIQTVRRLLQMAKQASDYWTKSYEYDDVWLEARPACNDCLTGYARVVKMSIPEIQNPFGQPFFSSFSPAVLDSITLVVEREPLWRGLPPGQLLGPMYNLLKNPDFELWNFGVVDSQPDSWTDLETLQITGQNSREAMVPNSGQYALKIRVSGSTAAGKAKGVTQIAESTKNNTEYTVVAWVRSDGVSNGVGRILVTYSSQLEVYRASDRHGWTLYTGKFTTGVADVVSINLEILTTAANTDGTIYIDSLMLLEGDFEEAAAQGTLPYMTSSHIVNHWDQPGGAVVEAGAINYVDVWNVPGDEDALVRLEVQNNTTLTLTNPIETINKIRIGQRRIRNVTRFVNYNDPVGIADATASSGDRVESGNLNASWVDITSKLIPDNIPDNQGRFRVFVRAYDNKAAGGPTLKLRLNYFVGTAGIAVKTLESVDAPIRQGWFVIGLTPDVAMIQEQKFSTNPPSQLGYAIQMSRSSGADKGYLDYSLVIPTDGGYLEATLNPGVIRGGIIVVDDTASLSIGGAERQSGWIDVFQITNLRFFAAKEFNGAIFFSGSDAANFIVDRFYQGQWTTVLTVPGVAGAGTDEGMEIYNGELYLGVTLSGSAIPLTVRKTNNNGASWSTVFTLPSETANSTKMKSFNSELFVAGTDGTPRVQVYRWNGTATAITYTSPVNYDFVNDFEVYAGKLYLSISSTGLNQSIILEYDPASNVWTQNTIIAGRIKSLIEFNGKLYGTNYTTGTVYVYDKVSWTQIFNPGTASGLGSSVVFEDKLYVGGAATSNFGVVYSTPDGITWERVYDPKIGFGGAVNDVTTLTIANGSIYAGVNYSGVPVVALVTTLVEVNSMSKVSAFQGGSFTAPPRRFNDPRRHRWVFSYDRENFVNNVDDKALIGLGYVPRYLTLRGAN